jgi:hypothetical protein
MDEVRMKIVALDLDADSPERCDVEVLLVEILLRRLASSQDRLVAAKWQKLLELVEALCADGPYPEAWGHVQGDELYLSPSKPANPVTVRVRADWRDFGPVVDGLPEMHYRLQIERRGAKLSRDARARSPEEAERIIREAFGWST